MTNLAPLKKIHEETNESLPLTGIGGMVENYIKKYFKDLEGNLPSHGLYHILLKEIEKPIISVTLDSVKGNQKKAAEILGINRNTLKRKIIDLGIKI